jgi:glycosyltransferase 2 family protein
VLERTAGQVVLFAGVLVLAQSAALRALATAPAIAVALGALCLVALAVFAALRWGRPRWRRGLATTLADLRTGLLSRDTWPAVVGLSTVVLVGHFALFVVAARTAGVTAPVSELVAPVALTLLASGLPINIGGWGPRESASALSFGAVGLGATQGLTVAVVYGVLTFVTTLPGAAVLLLRSADRPAGDEVQFEQRVVAECEPAGRSA